MGKIGAKHTEGFRAVAVFAVVTSDSAVKNRTIDIDESEGELLDEDNQWFEEVGFDEMPTENETDSLDEGGIGLQGSEHGARRVRLKVKTHPSLAKGYPERKTA